MPKKERAVEFIYHAGNRVVCFVGSVIFLFLCWYSFRFTQYMPPFALEFPVNQADSMVQNIVALGVVSVFVLLMWKVENALSQKRQKFIMRIVMFGMVIWTAVASFWWIFSTERIPGSDQFYICNDASSFMQGVYLSLEPGYYCDKYPQQLGLIALLELLFTFVGPFNYTAIQVILAAMAPGIAYFGYRIVREMTKSMTISCLYCLMMMGCLPLIFYTSWIYGEIPGVFFSLLAVWQAMRYVNQKKIYFLISCVLSFAMAMIVRKNSVIVIVAFVLTAFLWAMVKRDKRMMLTAVLAVLVPYLSFWGIQQMYEIRSGVEKSDGIPSSGLISLGLQEVDGRYGWDWGYEGIVFESCGYDKEAADAVYTEDIKTRLNIFKEDPAYAVHFFKEKQLSQWNAPLYQAYYFSQNYSEENPPAEDSLVNLLNTKYFNVLLKMSDRLQFVLYVGMLLYFLFAVRKDSEMIHHVLAVMVIGGFLFSMIWEAKARYVFPYYMGMFPVAVIGYQQFLLWAKDRGRKIACNFKGRKL